MAAQSSPSNTKDLLSMPVRHMRAYVTEASAVLLWQSLLPKRVHRGAWAECDSNRIVPTDSEPERDLGDAVGSTGLGAICFSTGDGNELLGSSSTDPSRCHVPNSRNRSAVVSAGCSGWATPQFIEAALPEVLANINRARPASSAGDSGRRKSVAPTGVTSEEPPSLRS